jgi:hypothetical protein
MSTEPAADNKTKPLQLNMNSYRKIADAKKTKPLQLNMNSYRKIAANSAASKNNTAAQAVISAAEASAIGAETAAPPNITKRLISVERVEGTNGKDATFIAKVVEEASSVLGLNKTPNALPANSTLMSRNGGRRKRHTHRKRTHKSHKRSHKSHKRTHR